MFEKQTLILVDDNDLKLGYEDKEKCHTIHDGMLGFHHRGLAVLIYNSKGEILLQHRRHKVFDGVWDLTGSTHPLVVHGIEESYEAATRRCLINEWIGLENVQLKFSSIFINYSARNPSNNIYCENEFCRLVVGLHDGAVQHRPESAYGHRHMLFTRLVMDLRSNPTKYAPWVMGLVNNIQQKQPKELSFLVRTRTTRPD